MSRGERSGSTTMEQKSVDELVAEYRKMALAGKALAPFASENLEHWLSNTGTRRVVAADPFKSESNVIAHLRTSHRAVFLSQRSVSQGIVPRIKANPGPGKYLMTWEDSMYAQMLTELYFALGGFTLRSKVEVSVVPDPQAANVYTVSFDSWQSQAYDDYNWDHGKSVNIPGWGRIDDKEALRVERAGRAKSYEIESQWWTVTHPNVVAPARISL